MAEDNKKTEDKEVKEAPKKEASKSSDTNFQPKKRGGKKFAKRGARPDRPKDEFDQKVVDLARVTRVMAGGKRMNFRATMVIGDRKGKVGVGIAKGADVSMAISKAVAQAKKKLITVPIIHDTLPHDINVKFKASKILIKPARHGSGIKAGGVVRIVLELAGVKDAVAKILGGNNKINNTKATILALNSFNANAVEAAKRSKKDAPAKKSEQTQAKKEVKAKKEAK